MYKTNPIQFLLIIAVIYLLLKQSNVIENLRPSKVQGEVNLQALSTVSQLAQKWNNAVEIDNTGNVKFKKNVIVDGRVGIGVAQPKANLDILGNSNELPCIKMGPNDEHGFEFYENTQGRFVLKRRDGSAAPSGAHNVMVIHRNNGTIEHTGTTISTSGEIKGKLATPAIAGYAVDGLGSTILLEEGGWWDLAKNNGKYNVWSNDAWDRIYLFRGWKLEFSENHHDHNGGGRKETHENKTEKVKMINPEKTNMHHHISSYKATWVGF